MRRLFFKRREPQQGPPIPLPTPCVCCGVLHIQLHDRYRGGFCHHCYEGAHWNTTKNRWCPTPTSPRDPDLQRLLDEEAVIEDRAAGERFRQEMIDFYSYRDELVQKYTCINGGTEARPIVDEKPL